MAGLGRLDIVVNNAGVLVGGPFDQLTEAQFDRMMAVNVKGVVLVTQAALPELRARGEGAIVNIASISGKTGRAFTAGYAASKFAVVGLTQALAHELGPANIRVNAVCPGLLRTTMWTDGVAPARAPSLGVPVTEAFDAFVRQTTPLGREQTPAGHRRGRRLPLPRGERDGHRAQRRGRRGDALTRPRGLGVSEAPRGCARGDPRSIPTPPGQTIVSPDDSRAPAS